MKLSATQRRALLKLLAYNPSGASSYELQESLATMQALARRDLARKKAGLGSIWSPPNLNRVLYHGQRNSST